MAGILLIAGLALGFVQEAGIPDIGVSYISRTPRAARYSVSYDTAGHLKWSGGVKTPVGKLMTYTAKIRNHGGAGEAFDYEMLVDGTAVVTGSSFLQPGGTTNVVYKMPYADHRQTVTMRVKPADTQNDPAINDERSIATDAYSLRFVVDPEVYTFFTAKMKTPSAWGTYAVEDWINQNVDLMNLLLERGGAKARFFVDTFLVSPTDLYQRSYTEDTGYDIQYVMPKQYAYPELGYPDALLNGYDWLSIALMGRYGGMAYDGFFALPAASNPMIDLGYDPPRGFFWDATAWFSPYDAGSMNVTNGFRRGFIGEYQYDVPEKLSVKIQDTLGVAIPNRKVEVYQITPNGTLGTTPILTSNTDANGMLALPNVNTVRRDTPTGHRLLPNPFGTIDFQGGNGLLFFRVYTPIKHVFGWLPISRVNNAFWSGKKRAAILDVVAYRYPTQLALLPDKLSVDITKGDMYDGQFKATTGVTKAHAQSWVVRGAEFLTVTRGDSFTPFNVKYHIDTTNLEAGKTYTGWIMVHDWSQGTVSQVYQLTVNVK